MNKALSLFLAIIALAIIAGLYWMSWRQDDDIQLAGKTKVRLQLQWFDQAQFIGFYVADQKGFYRDEALDVEILPGGYNVNPISKVRIGDADIGIATGDQVLLLRAEGHAIKAVGTVFNKSLACFISRKDLQIRNPSDLIGKKVGVYRGFDTDNVLLSLLKKNDIDASQVNIRDAGSFAAFVTGELEVFPSYLINEPIMAEENKIKVDILRPDNFGVHFYSDTLFVMEGFLNDNRDVVRRFLKASTAGWNYAQENQSEALDLMYRHTRGSGDNLVSAEHQREMLRISLQHIRGGNENRIFYMERGRWEDMERALFDIGRLKTQGHIGELCDFELANEGK